MDGNGKTASDEKAQRRAEAAESQAADAEALAAYTDAVLEGREPTVAVPAEQAKTVHVLATRAAASRAEGVSPRLRRLIKERVDAAWREVHGTTWTQVLERVRGGLRGYARRPAWAVAVALVVFALAAAFLVEPDRQAIPGTAVGSGDLGVVLIVVGVLAVVALVLGLASRR